MNKTSTPTSNYNKFLGRKTLYLPKHIDRKRKSAWLGHIPFSHSFIKKINPNKFVELGTHHGGSYFSFCDSVLKNSLQTTCYAVDTWEGEEHAGFYEEDVYQFVDNYNKLNFSHFSNLLQMTFEGAVKKFDDQSVDLIHIDGFHSYEAVHSDYETWKQKMSPNGFMLFHDTSVEQPGFGVKRFWNELMNKYPNQCFEFYHSHGLGVFSLDSGSPISEKLGFTMGRESEYRQRYEKQAVILGRTMKWLPKPLWHLIY